MTEIWDVYDESGRKTGKTMMRGKPKPGEYMLGVHVYLHTPDKRFLVQKRSMCKQSHPGIWDVTGGAVLSGEDSRLAAIRETREEVGILLSEDSLRLIKRVKQRKSFADIYFAEWDFDLSDCTIQEAEVEEIRLVDGEELLRIEREERRRDESYMNVITEAVRYVMVRNC